MSDLSKWNNLANEILKYKVLTNEHKFSSTN